VNSSAPAELNIQEIITDIYNQSSYYDYENPQWTSLSGAFMSIIWKDIDKFGCGTYKNFMVCQICRNNAYDFDSMVPQSTCPDGPKF
jgi:hypothetical protein